MHRLTATDTPMVRYTRTIFPSYAQADLVCLNENPLENISNVRKINKVIQSGKIVIDNN